MSQLKLSFLGTFEAMLGNKPLINFRSAKVQGLLIYLSLMQQQAQQRDLLATLFWPDEPEKRAKHNLRQTLYRLRRLLEDTKYHDDKPFLLITRATVQFNSSSDHSLDVVHFLAAMEGGELETAVSHYSGDLLPGFSCHSLPFDDWLRTERERLHRLALDALFECAALSLTQGDMRKAQNLARRQLALEPWHEEAHQQLMQALALSGDRSAALAQYETCRLVLKEELCIGPTAETKTLATRIREQQLKIPAPRQTNTPQRLTTPFVGRHREYETLVKAYRQAANGTLQVVSLVGNSGIGKTRLAQQFLAWAATQGADVMVGSSFETSAGLSYQPLTHLLRRRIERENAPEDLLSDLWLSQLTRLLPELRDRYPDLPEPTQDETTARQHLFEAITRLGQALAARQPLVLFIDDWHWADTASLDVLHYAAQRWAEEALEIGGVPILVLLTMRQEALTESVKLQSWLNQLKRTVSAGQLNLSELSAAETAQLVQGLLAPEAANGDKVTTDLATSSSLTQFSDWLFKETDGQPLFLAEALKVLAEEGLLRPEVETAVSTSGQAVWQLDWLRFDAQKATSTVLSGLAEIIQGWLTRVSTPAVTLLTATAVLAQAATFDNLCRVTGLDELQAITALDELLNFQLLLETDETKTWADNPVYAFSHQKVSEVIYLEAGTARRRLLHRRAFEVLQALTVPASDLAYHALNAGLLAETIRFCLIAGNEAMDLFAVRVALIQYETAWQVVEQHGWPEGISGADRESLYTGLGRVYELVESWTKAEEIYKAMIAAAQSIGAAAMECQGINSLATIYYLKFDQGQQAVALLERALALAKQHGNQRGIAETELNLAMAAYQNQDYPLTLHHAEQALEIARDLEHPQLMARHLSLLSYIYLQQRKWDKVEAYSIEASQLYTKVANLVLAADNQRNVGFSQMLLGKPRESLATLEETAAFSRQIENQWGETECTWKLAYARLELGHYGQAIRLGRQGVELCRKLNMPSMIDLSLLVWGTVLRTIISLDSAREALLEVLTASTERHVFDVTIDWALTELCTVNALANDWGQAYDFARQRLKRRDDESLLPMGLSGWFETEALLRGGNEDLAQAGVNQLCATVGNNRRYRLPLLRSQAVLAQWDGEVAQAIVHLQDALLLARQMSLPGEAWPIWGKLGKLYAELGEDVKAKGAYREAGVIIRRLAETIEDEALRDGFVTADPIQSILERIKDS